MRVKINIHENGWGSLRYEQPMLCEEKVGLLHVENSMMSIFDVIDEKLFFLSVIKYGMSFTVLDNASKVKVIKD